jgi:hypothetical protein
MSFCWIQCQGDRNHIGFSDQEAQPSSPQHSTNDFRQKEVHHSGEMNYMCYICQILHPFNTIIAVHNSVQAESLNKYMLACNVSFI